MAWRSELRAALRHPDEPRVLLLRIGGEWRLPRVVVGAEAWVADADAAIAAFEKRLGTRPWLVRQLLFAEDGERHRIETVYELELLDRDWRPPAHGRWISRGELDRVGDEPLRALLDAYLGDLERGVVPKARPPWARPGWREEVVPWLEEQAAALGHEVRAVEQVKQWSISSVLRVRTDGPTLYLKAAAALPLFVEEASVTAALAARFPGFVPTPVAHRPDTGWLLLPEFEPVSWESGTEERAEFFRRFAVLQRRSTDLVDELVGDGVLDRRIPRLVQQLEPVLADKRVRARLEPAQARELTRRRDDLLDACRRLDALGVPPALVHGDLHPGNVARLGGDLVYFDWTDACVAPPLFDLHSLQWIEDTGARQTILDAYLEPWEGFVPAEAVALARVVTPLHHAVSYWTIATNVEPSSRSELDATHAFVREALARLRDL